MTWSLFLAVFLPQGDITWHRGYLNKAFECAGRFQENLYYPLILLSLCSAPRKVSGGIPKPPTAQEVPTGLGGDGTSLANSLIHFTCVFSLAVFADGSALQNGGWTAPLRALH